MCGNTVEKKKRRLKLKLTTTQQPNKKNYIYNINITWERSKVKKKHWWREHKKSKSITIQYYISQVMQYWNVLCACILFRCFSFSLLLFFSLFLRNRFVVATAAKFRVYKKCVLVIFPLKFTLNTLNEYKWHIQKKRMKKKFWFWKEQTNKSTIVKTFDSAQQFYAYTGTIHKISV